MAMHPIGYSGEYIAPLTDRMSSVYRPVLIMALVFWITGCGNSGSSQTLFEELPPERTGIHFINRLEEKPGNNILESEFYYNGGGVAVGDINNDGLPDLYFTANQGENALYLNRGDFRFENVTHSAGLEDPDGWTAGAAMADITGNGRLDIYVCKAGKVPEEERRNKLFINNGVDSDTDAPIFTERAAEYGLDDPGYCTQPVFFDYNGNGLLDLFIVNYNTRHFRGFDIRTIREEYDPNAGDRLYRNNGDGTFTDVSREAGIMQNPIGFGLSATVSDLNGNGRPDIYVTNDFMERDYMYINRGDGTFRDEILLRTGVTSYFSMGSDIADINNNGFPDILVADMLPPEHKRRSVFKTPDYTIYDQLVDNGYHRKNMRNTLQLNNGEGVFTEAGRLAGISMTDWSWATLIADFDNSGRNDIYITNGFPRFYTNLDYLNNILWEQYPDEDLPDDPELKYQLVQQMEKVEMHNVSFRNSGDLRFVESTEEWGLKKYTISGGAAYVDLNNDGALDLVVSNINELPLIYRNQSREQNGNNYLKVRLEGTGPNTGGIGAKVKLTGRNGQVFFREAFYTRGFQSSVDQVLHFGLGQVDTITVEVTWPDSTRQVIDNVTVNRTLVLNQSDARIEEELQEAYVEDPAFLLLNESALGFDYQHEGSFSRDRILNPLMPHTLSNLSPALAVSDLNNDGLPDLYVGGGQGQPGALYLQQTDGAFMKANVPDFEKHSHYEDMDALFFDANGNGINDLYVVSGGNSDPLNGPGYQDRLYLNDGFGNFRYHATGVPKMHTSGGTVIPIDLEDNGLWDLFVGGRVLTGQYPASPRSYLLRNNGGTFTDVTEEFAPDLIRPGLVTDAAWVDVNGDEQQELIIVGEWMPVRIFKKQANGKFSEVTAESGLEKTTGWWNTLKIADLNGNGLPDIVAGNRGLNSFPNTSPEEPVVLYYGDFNNNGLKDPIITYTEQGNRYPLPGRDLFLRQLPGFGEQFPEYASWANADINGILTSSQLQQADRFTADTFASMIFINQGDGTFMAKPLPAEAQLAPIYDMILADFSGNGLPDILAAGNNFGTAPETGPLAGHGTLLMAEGDFDYSAVSSKESGFFGDGDVRKMSVLQTSSGPLILLSRNDDGLLAYLFRGF